MMKIRLILLLWTVLSFSGNSALAQTAPTAVLNPAEGVNASLGSTVTFTCIIDGTDDVLWIVDGNSDPTVQREMGITQNRTVGQPDETFISRIHVSSTMENNGIEIVCRAIGTLSNGQSETVTLFVQGLLSSPTALGISDSEGPTRRLSWTPPPTLDLTDVHPDISHYNVCSSILNEVSCRNVEGTELSFLNIRMGIEFSVFAVNVVGEGNASTINHEPCDSTTAPTQVDGDLVTSDISLQSSGTTPSVTFSFGKGGGDANCFNLYRIEASPSNQGTPLTQGPMFPTVSKGEDNSVSVTSGLVRNTVYSVSIVSVNVNGENPSKGDIQFSTYDVQSIQSSTRPGAIAVTCSFTIGSVASSCIVRICEVVNGNISTMCQDLPVPRNPSASETTRELNNLQPGVYAIVGVTVNSGGEMIPFTSGDMTFLQLQNMEVIVGPPTTPTMVIDFTVGPTGQVNPESNTGVIAGSVIGAIAVIIIVLIVIVVVLIVLQRQSDSGNKTEAVSLTTTEMWLEDSTDSGTGTRRLTQSGKDSLPLEMSAIENTTSSPLSEMAVIQGKNGCHVEIDLSDSNILEELQLDSVELTEDYPPPAYEILSASQPDVLLRGAPVVGLVTDSGTRGRLSADDIHEVKLTSSLDDLSKGPRHMRTPSNDFIYSQSIESINSQGQYAEIDHRVGKKPKKTPKDNDLVLYSEIKVDELRPVVPQKRRHKPAQSTDSLPDELHMESFHV